MMHKSLYSHLPVVDHSGHSVGVVDIVKLSMHLHDLISKVLPSIHPTWGQVKRQCTVQSLFSMWEESQSATVVGDGGWSPGGLGIDDIEQIPLHKSQPPTVSCCSLVAVAGFLARAPHRDQATVRTRLLSV